MNWVKGFTLAICLATPLSPFVVAAFAEPAATPAATETAKPATPAASKPAMSEADKRAKANECSRQADAKKLHGEERKKFREACKRK